MFTKKKFDFIKFCDELSKSIIKKVLFVGIGGGCDMITAYSFHKLVKETIISNNSKFDEKSFQYVYANTKRRPYIKDIPVTKHIFRVPDEVISLEKITNTYGSTIICHSIPRGFMKCPLVFILKRKTTKTLIDIEELTQEIKSFKFSNIIAIDSGGDSLVNCGSDTDERDKEMLEVCKKCVDPSNLIHVVVAPGGDGETKKEDMEKTIDKSYKNEYLGCIEIPKSMVETLKDSAKYLSKNRTPNIVSRAFFNEKSFQKSKKIQNGVIIERSFRNHIPLNWLKIMLFFQYNKK